MPWLRMPLLPLALAFAELSQDVGRRLQVERLAAAAGFALELRLVPGSPSDPLIARYQAGIDRTLLRRNLRLSVDQRIRALAKLQEFHAEVRRATRAVRRDGTRRR